jgi:phosphatidate cytidylyltransferase
VLRYRLTLGPLLIVGLFLICWLDQGVQGAPISRFWQRALLQHEPRIPPGLVLFGFAIVASILASRELSSILKDKGIKASKRIMTTASIAGLIVSCFPPGDWSPTLSVAFVSSAAVGVLLLSILFYSRHRTTEGAVAAAGGTLLSFVYLGLMFGFVFAIRRHHTAWLLLWVILTTKASDIGAFATGKAIGRHKLILWLSPGKTWEGLFGGIALSMVVGAVGLWVLDHWHIEEVPSPWTGALAGAVFGLTGVVGDLIASLFKRDAGMKDAGRVLPGFGGMLDVLDSALLVAPVAFWWLWIVHAS